MSNIESPFTRGFVRGKFDVGGAAPPESRRTIPRHGSDSRHLNIRMKPCRILAIHRTMGKGNGEACVY